MFNIYRMLFLALKMVWMVKIFPHQIPITWYSLPLGEISPISCCYLDKRWRVVPSKHLKYGTKKVPFAASLIYWFSMFLLTVLHMKPRNFVKSQVQMFHFLNLKIWSKSVLPNLLLRTKISFNKHCHKPKNNQCPTKCYQYFSNRMKVCFSSLDKHYI